MKDKLYNILVLLIILLAIIIRIISWPNGYGDINCDEAMLAINARSISKNGTDIYGTNFPVYFEAWLNSGQSALPTYITALSISIFGFNLFAIRLPMLLLSIISVYLIFKLTKKMFNNQMGIITLFLIAINPWHIMQSQWNLDCNFFPHIFLIGIYLLYVAIENEKTILLYMSMILFALSMYCYGVSIYFVPLFLIIVGIYLLKTKQVKLREFIICIIIYLLIFLPLLLMYIINYFQLDTINIGIITIQRFIHQTRTSEMLIFSQNIIEQLKLNILSLIQMIITQNDYIIWNRIKEYGTIYLFSIVFIVVGIIDFNKEKNKNSKLILFWLIVSLFTGMLVNDININRLNIIWYPLIILSGYGVYSMYKSIRNFKIKYAIIILIILIYIVSFIMFSIKLYNSYQKAIKYSNTFSGGFVEAIEFINKLDCNEVIVSELANTSGHYVYYRFALDYDYNKCIPKEELLKYHMGNRKEIYWFNNEKIKFQTIDLKSNQDIKENIYLMLTREKKYINNISEYTEKNFGKYCILLKNI